MNSKLNLNIYAFIKLKVFCCRKLTYYLGLPKMFLLKIKGTAKIPDYVQMRNDDFTLLAYFRADRPEKALVKAGYGDKEEYLLKIINELPYGKVTKVEV